MHPSLSEEVEYKFQYIEFGPSLRKFFFGSDSILIREEYWELLKHITDYQQIVQGRQGAMILTGHPRIGKSLFLCFTLVYRVIHGLHTAFESHVGRIYFFGDFYQLYDRTDAEGHPGAWALTDSNDQPQQPSGNFIIERSTFFTLQAASPQPMRWKTWSKYRRAEILAMKLWL